ncbi:30S ribosomal protein S20 [Serinicoccus sediminis]|uniref:30S ribosomal protein S20 n=1 Tax=Serinicoccus sediminis TaxID=2306021 RepID=UPI00101F0607|nr:30S ribosomal protein S20 [Serinicoccus sediminis]
MANIKSQIKRVKTNAARTERNRAHKSELRTFMRKFREAADSGDTGKAQDALHAASRKLDKAVTKGVIHQNQAANKKSAMAKRFNALGG